MPGVLEILANQYELSKKNIFNLKNFRKVWNSKGKKSMKIQRKAKTFLFSKRQFSLIYINFLLTSVSNICW